MDQRFVVDIILKARDDTAAAFARATGNVEALKSLTKQTEKDIQSYGEAWDRVNKKIAASQDQLKRRQKELNVLTHEGAEAQVKLEKATQDYVKTMGDARASEAQRVAAMGRMIEAEKGLVNAIKFTKENTNGLMLAEAKKHAQFVKNTNVEIAQLSVRAQKEKENAEAAIKLDKDKARARQELTRILDAAEADSARRRQAEREQELQEILALEGERRRAAEERRKQLEEEIKAGRAARDAERQEQARFERTRLESIRRISEAARGLARPDLTPESFAEYHKQIGLARREIEATGISARRTGEIAARAMRDAREEAGFATRQQLEHAQAINRATTMYREYGEQIGRIRRLQEESKEAEGARKVLIELDAASARREAMTIKTELEAVLRHIEANVDLDSGAFHAQAAEIMALKTIIGRDINIDVDIDTHGAEQNLERFGNRGRSALGQIFDSISDGGNRIAAFDNLIRGAFTFLITGFLQPLIILAGAAAAALVALASSAIMAGGAIGGALAAGIAQALPMLGLLIAVAMRLKAVMDVVQQANLLQEQQSYQQETQNKRLVDTQSQVAGALQNVQQAQLRLNEARAEARRQLEDLILAERRAELAARGAALAQEDAQAALRQAIASGGDVEQAQLGVDEAGLRRQESVVGLGRARQDAAAGRRAGPEGMPAVVQAKAGLEDATRALERAKRAGDQAAVGMTAAAGKLAYLMGQLSPAERRLAKIFQRFQDVGREFAQVVTGPLIESTGKAVNRIAELMQDSRITNAFRGLGKEIAEQGDALFRSFTNPRAISQFLGFIREARRNLEPLRRIIQNLGHIFLDIGEAGGPALRKILDWLSKITSEWAKWTGSREGQRAMMSFFREGVKHLKAWMDLFGSVVKLFAAIAGPGGGAKAGLDLIQGMTRGINRLTDNINKGGKAAEWFQKMWDLMKFTFKEIGPVFESIGREINKTFDEGGRGAIKGFATLMADVLIPALGQFVRGIGRVVGAVGSFLDQHPRIARMTGAFIALFAALGFAAKAQVFFGPFVKIIELIAKRFIFTASRVAAMRIAVMNLGRVLGAALLGPLGLVIGLVVLIIQKFKLWDDIWRGLKRAFNAFMEPIRPAFNELKRALEDAGVSFGGIGSALDGLRPVFEWLVRRIMPLVTGGFRMLGPPIAFVIRIIANLIETISGVVGAFKKIFSGDIIGGLKDLGEAMLNGILGPFEALGQLFLDLFETAWETILEFFGVSSPSKKMAGLGEALLDGLVAGLKGLLDILMWPFRQWWRLFRGFWGGIIGGIKDRFGGLKDKIGDALSGVKNAIVDPIKEGLEEAWGFLRDAPGKAFRLAEKVVGKLGEGFSGVANAIAEVFKAAVDKIGDVASTIGKAFARLIDKILPDHIPVPHAPDIPLPANPLKDLGLYAGGGFVGKEGERGQDNQATLLGRGEAVLNWAHQKVVNAALKMAFGIGLPQLFGSVRTAHAGFARGGFAGMAEGGYSMPAIAPRGMEGWGAEATDALNAARMGGMVRFLKAIAALAGEGGIIERMGEAIERMADRLDRRVAMGIAGLRRGDNGGLRGARPGRVTIRRDGQRVNVRATEENVLTAEIQNLNLLEDEIRRRLRTTRATMRQVERAIERLKRGGISDAERARFQQLMGRRFGLLDQIAEQENALIENRNEHLQKIRDRFAAQVAEMEARFENSDRRRGLRDRLAAVTEGLGDRLGASQMRVRLSREAGADMRVQASEYERMIRRARRMGDDEQVKALTQKLDDLRVQIQENIVTTQDLVIASRQLSIDILTGQTERATGIIGAAQGIIQKIGEASGMTDPARAARFQAAIGAVLEQAATKIVGAINATLNDPSRPFGQFSAQAGGILGQLRDAFLASPETFADSLVSMAPQIAELEAQMPESMRTLFANLIDAMTGNTQATLDNNDQLDQLTGQQGQSWSSEAWAQFRIAIFNGMGGLLPTYETTIPSLQSGGRIVRDGLAYLHAAEVVRGEDEGGGDTFITDLDIHQAGDPIDPDHLVEVIALKRPEKR